MTTAADWISETEQHLDVRSKEVDKLNGAISSTSAAALTVAYGNTGIAPGVVLGVDLELMYVWAYDSTTKIATVERGWLGSTPATHTDTSIVYINPVYSKYAIFRALNQDLESLASAGLYTISTVELTYSTVAAAYDLTSVTNIEGIYAVEANFPGLSGDWRRIGYTIGRNQNTTDFASGYALTVADGFPGLPVRVLYKSRFTALTSLSSTKVSTGLPSSAYDIPPLGAAARLVSPREVARNDTSSQGDTRRAEEVPMNAVRGAAAGLWALRTQRVGEELTSLRRRYPALASITTSVVG